MRVTIRRRPKSSPPPSPSPSGPQRRPAQLRPAGARAPSEDAPAPGNNSLLGSNSPLPVDNHPPAWLLRRQGMSPMAQLNPCSPAVSPRHYPGPPHPSFYCLECAGYCGTYEHERCYRRRRGSEKLQTPVGLARELGVSTPDGEERPEARPKYWMHLVRRRARKTKRMRAREVMYALVDVYCAMDLCDRSGRDWKWDGGRCDLKEFMREEKEGTGRPLTEWDFSDDDDEWVRGPAVSVITISDDSEEEYCPDSAPLDADKQTGAQ